MIQIRERWSRRSGAQIARWQICVPILVVLVLAAAAIPAVRSVVRQAAGTGAGGVVTAGGTVAAQSSTHRVSGALGQLSVGRAQSATQQFESGFWSGGACDCRFHGDTNGDGVVNIFDLVEIVNTAFRSGPNPLSDALCPHFNRGDVNCDWRIDIFDIVITAGVAFRSENYGCDPCADAPAP